MSTVGGNLSKLNRVHNYKHSPIHGIKTISVFQRLHGEIGRTNSDVQKRDGQTKNSTFFAASAAGEIRAQPNLA